MTDQAQWKRDTAIRHVAAEQDGVNPPPLERSFASAARYVGAETEEVRRWWQGRGEVR